MSRETPKVLRRGEQYSVDGGKTWIHEKSGEAAGFGPPHQDVPVQTRVRCAFGDHLCRPIHEACPVHAKNKKDYPCSPAEGAFDEAKPSPLEEGSSHFNTATFTLPEALQAELIYTFTSKVLDALALSGEPQPYSRVAPIVGFHHRDRAFYVLLGRSLREDHAAGKPLRAALIINKQTGLPGSAFFEVCRSLGYVIPPGGEEAFWYIQLQRVSGPP